VEIENVSPEGLDVTGWISNPGTADAKQGKVSCPRCGRLVHAIGLSQHKMASKRCRAAARTADVRRPPQRANGKATVIRGVAASAQKAVKPAVDSRTSLDRARALVAQSHLHRGEPPAESRGRVVTGPAPSSPPKLAKRARDAQAAARLGITVDQLLARRRSEAAENMRLHEEATRLGISVKELRKRRGLA
jgi:hypothetical protein